MKIGLFTDVHYCRADALGKTRRPSLSLRKLREAMDEDNAYRNLRETAEQAFRLFSITKL